MSRWKFRFGFILFFFSVFRFVCFILGVFFKILFRKIFVVVKKFENF